MSSRRTLILVAAIAIGAIAAFLVWGYVGGIQDKAYDNAEKVPVYVVAKQVTKGTYGEEAVSGKLIVKDEIPKEFYPSTAIQKPEIDLAGKVAVNDLAVNQIVTTSMFADPTSVQQTFADRLEKIQDQDQVAITISVDQVRGVAGLLQPGDYVNVMATEICEGGVSTAGGSSDTDAGAADKADPCDKVGNLLFGKQARYIYQKAQILAIDQTPVAQPGEVKSTSEDGADDSATAAQNRGLITLIVPTRAAQYVASIPPENIYLSLVSRDYKPTPQTAILLTDRLPGEDASKLTPYGPKGPGNE